MLAAIPLSVGKTAVLLRHPPSSRCLGVSSPCRGCSFKQFCFMEVHTWSSTTPGPGSAGLSWLRIDPSDRGSDPAFTGVPGKWKNNKDTEKQESVQWMFVEHQFSFSFCFLGQMSMFFALSLSSWDCMPLASTSRHLICRDCLKCLSLHNIHLPLGCKSAACVSLC